MDILIEIMRIRVNLQISKNKKSACFYIPTSYKDKILKFKDIDSLVTCIDCTPQIKFVAKLYMNKSDKYTKFLFTIPRKYIHYFIKNSSRRDYIIDVKQF